VRLGWLPGLQQIDPPLLREFCLDTPQRNIRDLFYDYNKKGDRGDKYQLKKYNKFEMLL
jgi:hypothetical protein